MCDRQPATEDPLGDLLAGNLFTPSGVEEGPSAIDSAVMQAASPNDVPQLLAGFYETSPAANS
jgi:hypothetical protein